MTDTNRPTRILVLSMDERLLMPRLFQPLIEERGDQIVGVCLTSVFPRRRWLKALVRHARFAGPIGCARDALAWGVARGLDWWTRVMLWLGRRPRRFFSLRTLARASGIPTRRISDVNSDAFVTWLAAQDLDLIVCQVPDLLGAKLLRTARLGCLNKHASLLPKYRGLHPVFWALLAGEREVGVTFHLMTERIDAGPIVLQRSFEVGPQQTVYGVYEKLFGASGPLLIEAIRELENGHRLEPRTPESSRYYSHPTRADMRRFHRSGRHFGVPTF